MLIKWKYQRYIESLGRCLRASRKGGRLVEFTEAEQGRGRFLVRFIWHVGMSTTALSKHYVYSLIVFHIVPAGGTQKVFNDSAFKYFSFFPSTYLNLLCPNITWYSFQYHCTRVCIHVDFELSRSGV